MHIKNIDETFGFATRSVHAGNEIDKETGAIRRPITMANSYELPYDPSDLNWSSAGGNLYTRNGSANQGYLQEKLRSLHKSEVSLGHDESLIVFLGENDERQELYPEEFHGGFFRLSVGLEDTDDLINDIEQALSKIASPPYRS